MSTGSQLPQSGIGIPASGSVRYHWSRISRALPSYANKDLFSSFSPWTLTLKYFITNVHCTVIQYLIILSHTLKKCLYLLYSLLLLLLCIQEYFSQFIEKVSVFLNSLTHNEKSVHFYQVLEDLQLCFHHCLWFWSSRSKNNDSFSYTLQ